MASLKGQSHSRSDGYALQFGCVSGGDFGAMGLHFVKGSLVGDGEIDVARPEIVLYEPMANGRVRITGADARVETLLPAPRPGSGGASGPALAAIT